jgi:peptide/nickel transport system substrate-binding protein
MREKILQIRCLLRSLSFREKIAFLILTATFAAAATGILKKIDQSKSVEVPKEGGTLIEGVIGAPRFVNPVLAISDADRDIANLIYSGLMRLDGEGNLAPDLAEKYEVSDDGLVYTFTLKENIFWPDKKPLTTDDIIFTIQQLKNTLVKSPQRASWEGVETEKIDNRIIRFLLKRPYAPFIGNTTIGILPKHVWAEISPEQMSLSDYNTNPTGSGPYKISKISRTAGIITSYTLEPNKKFALEKPYIKNLVLKFYPSEKKILEAYQKGEVESVGGVSPQNIINLQKTGDIKTLLLPRVFAAFFNQNNAIVLSKKEIRQALELATDKRKIVNEVLRNFGTTLNYSLPPGIIGSFESQEENPPPYEDNLKEAARLLKKASWKFNEGEKMFEKKISKNEILKLEFDIATSNSPELIQTAELLKSMWETLGAKINVKIFEIGDLEQNVIRPRKYDVLLFGLVTGQDPDPFAFWHSSQRNDPGLNIALYTNIKTDKLLEEARTISDIKKREEKYRDFQKQIKEDIPAIFLYSPYYIYATPKSLKGFDAKSITIPSERFSQAYKWYIETEKVWKNSVK